MFINFYHDSLIKKIFDFVLSIVIFIFLLPFFLFIMFLVWVTSGCPIFFVQKRVGKNEKIFKITKFRTMKIDAEKQRINYLYLNEADGPVFKIQNDPRFTKFGHFLSLTGLDELPQFLDVFKGKMNLVGPRPLPIYEYNKLSKVQRLRNVIKPGITSLWVIKGSHNLSFNEWMKLDKKYIEEANLFMDLNIIFKTMLITLKTLIHLVCNN